MIFTFSLRAQATPAAVHCGGQSCIMRASRLSLALERLSIDVKQHYRSLCPTQRRLLLRVAPRATFTSSSRRPQEHQQQESFKAAPPINFSERLPISKRIRVVPASPSYFTAKPYYTDTLLELRALLRRHEVLPTTPEPPKVAWKTLAQYHARIENGEQIDAYRYERILAVLRRLNAIHPALMPEDVKEALARHRREIDPYENRPKQIFLDEWGRAMAVGRRKSSTAKVYIVEGEGEVLVNGKSLTQFFGRIHDRESAVWPLKVTQRLDKYNVWALVRGGGVTGQAEALTLAVAKALVVMEPGLRVPLKLGERILLRFVGLIY